MLTIILTFLIATNFLPAIGSTPTHSPNRETAKNAVPEMKEIEIGYLANHPLKNQIRYQTSYNR
jgi:hypothetical protein